MKLKIFVILTFVGIILIYFSCNIDNDLISKTTNDEIINSASEIFDLSTLKMPYFSNADEYFTTIEKVKDLKGQEYLNWEKQYGVQTIYGDYTRAKMEIDTITTWNSYLDFRKKWESKVLLLPIEDSTIVCYPRKLGDISWVDTKLLNDNLAYKIENKTYLYSDGYTLIFNSNVIISKTEIANIISSKNNSNKYNCLTVRRKFKNNILDFRDSPNGFPAYKECSDYWDDEEDHWYCRERRLKGFLSDIYVATIYSGSILDIYIYQEYWEEFHRKVGWLGWVSNEVDGLGINGSIDGQMTVKEFDENGNWLTNLYYYFILGVHVNQYNNNELFSFDQKHYVVNLRENNDYVIINLNFNYGSSNDLIHYYGEEELSRRCNYEVVELNCQINYP